jgi:hypothetical protein
MTFLITPRLCWATPTVLSVQHFNLVLRNTLIKQLTFQKVEATAEDVLVILRTLYEHAGDLGVDAKTQISFHANVLLAAEGGFRPGTLGNYLRICIRKLAESRNVLGRTNVT